MIPIETLWIGLALIFAIVGVVRGFLKELGVTLVLIVLLFGLRQLSDNLGGILGFAAATVKQDWISDLKNNAALWLIVYMAVFLVVVFIAYEGYVIKYPGEDPRGIQGRLLAMLVGLVNGYLVAGSLWFYVDLYKEPVQRLGLLRLPYTPVAERMLQVLPPAMLGPYLPFLIVFMIILLVIK